MLDSCQYVAVTPVWISLNTFRKLYDVETVVNRLAGLEFSTKNPSLVADDGDGLR